MNIDKMNQNMGEKKDEKYLNTNLNLTCSLNTSNLTYNGKFSILSFNVDRAVPHEITNPFSARSSRIVALIMEADADIVNIQELRELTGTTPVMTWLGQFAPKYRFIVGFRNPGLLAFGQAILYKPSHLFPMEQQTRWLSSTPTLVSDQDPKGFGCIVVSARFAPVHAEKIIADAPTFWVDNLHFPLGESQKTACCERYVELIHNRKEETIATGDLNLFPDGDESKQRDILINQGKLQDFGKVAKTLGGRPWVSTFVGFESDKFKAPLDSDRKSRLDHILASPGITHAQDHVVLYTKTMLAIEPPEMSSRDLPSDHLPLLTTFYIPIKIIN